MTEKENGGKNNISDAARRGNKIKNFVDRREKIGYNLYICVN